jgi:hypothetical protein
LTQVFIAGGQSRTPWAKDLRREARFLGVEMPLILQFSIALFTGMVAVTLVPSIRKSVPKPIEIALWTALIAACVIGVLGITSPNARELTSSAIWGVDQIIGTSVGLLFAGILGWLGDSRFAISTWTVIACGVDIMALALVRSHRQSLSWYPTVRLGEWMELPRLVATPEPVVLPYALDGVNRRLAAATAVAGARLLTLALNLFAWGRNVLLPRQAERLAHAAAIGRVESRARLDSFRDTASQLQFAARAWYTVAGAPAVNDLATKASDVARTVKSGQLGDAAGRKRGRLADIRVLLSAQSLGWYGPMQATPNGHLEEEGKDESGQAGRLAS